MTVNDIRKAYPAAMLNFYDEEGWEYKGFVFLFSKVPTVVADIDEDGHGTVSIYLQTSSMDCR